VLRGRGGRGLGRGRGRGTFLGKEEGCGPTLFSGELARKQFGIEKALSDPS